MIRDTSYNLCPHIFWYLCGFQDRWLKVGLIGWMPKRRIRVSEPKSLIFVTADQPISLSHFPYLYM